MCNTDTRKDTRKPHACCTRFSRYSQSFWYLTSPHFARLSCSNSSWVSSCSLVSCPSSLFRYYSLSSTTCVHTYLQAIPSHLLTSSPCSSRMHGHCSFLQSIIQGPSITLPPLLRPYIHSASQFPACQVSSSFIIYILHLSLPVLAFAWLQSSVGAHRRLRLS
jgi:hypothetical protein